MTFNRPPLCIGAGWRPLTWLGFSYYELKNKVILDGSLHLIHLSCFANTSNDKTYILRRKTFQISIFPKSNKLTISILFAHNV